MGYDYRPFSTDFYRLKAVSAALEEVFIMLLLWSSAAAVYFYLSLDSLDLLLWFIVLLVQSLPYVAAFCISVISAFPALRSELFLSRKKL
ncbi:MAG: hypothetical protein KZQ70_00940 [gamma proteobacterium symbiont of Lucinoma myriamae]|nr:hypothetical protein [gamma proteobacterium symbiont of Lucinoma myriamae]MCU7819449.1 hypothetical protein [gamma proteobacterium symbiont of Lucinoma myriamae]MCU7831142.1 hypothetical protein [gamma proteobacterium symbiont of Lucinoma myriamae]